MNFKDLTEEQIKYARSVYTDKALAWDERMKILMDFFGKSERTVRIWCSKKLNFAEKTAPEPKVLQQAKLKAHDKERKIFFITAAQNATKVHKNLLCGMHTLATEYNAEVLVIPYRYKNATSIWTEQQETDEWWDESILPYLTLNRHDLNNAVSILSDIKIQPTSSQPLQGLEGMTGDHSCVVGHPRIELKALPVMEGNRPKIMFTTGACTVENYSDTKQGKKGEFHHSLGFAVVEIKDKDTFFFRQVQANAKGEFIDLFTHVDGEKISKETEVEAIALGDIHVRHCDPRITDITLNNLFKKLKPKKVFLHDIMDSQSVSHHNLKDPFLLHKLEMSGATDLAAEVTEMLEWLKPFEKYNTYIVKSNHDEHIDKFLETTDWRRMTTLKNAIPYMEYSMARLKGKAENGVVPYIINERYPKFKCLGHDDNVKVKGWLMSVHGHIGASGSRGSVAQYSRLSTKSLTGHSHTICRVAGAASVGTSTYLRVGYNKGASAWVNSHGIVNRLGKLQHIVFFHTKDGVEYTTLK